MTHEEDRPLTADEVREYFEEFMRKLQVSARASLTSDMEISEYVGAMHMFDTYYERLLQEYYDSIEFIEGMAKNKGTKLESEFTPQYVKAWSLLKEVPLVKHRWHKRKKTF